MATNKSFIKRVQKMVDAVGSQRALSRLIGVRDPTIISWLQGTVPHESTLSKVTKVSGLSMEWLLRGEGEEEHELEKIKSLINNPRILLMTTRLKAGYSINEFANLIGYQLGVLQAVEEGHARISEKMADAIVRVLPDLDKEVLMSGSDTPQILEESGLVGTYGAKPGINLPGHKVRYVPLLSWAQAGTLDNGFVDDAYDHTGVVAIDMPDAKAFAVDIRGNSMEPQIMEGDTAIVCPSWQPRAGDTVICRTVNGDIMCKLFQSKKSGELIMLSSYNSAYPPVELKREEIAWIYPVGQTSRKMRKA